MTAYWIAHVTVTDPEIYKEYQKRAAPLFAQFGGKLLARGGTCEVMEGPALDRHVIIEFASLQDAKACYSSTEYQDARQFRLQAAIAHITLVDGVEQINAS
jgi:uncharacterized protein (DUF1330 family)